MIKPTATRRPYPQNAEPRLAAVGPAAMTRHIQMEMIAVIAIRLRPQDGAKGAAGGFPDPSHGFAGFAVRPPLEHSYQRTAFQFKT